MTREELIVVLYREGGTLAAVGAAVGISGERVRQILRRAGVGPDQGGQSLRALRSRTVQREDADARCRRKWGIGLSEYRQLRAMAQTFTETPMGKFSQQRASAARRGIGWSLTFCEWWTIWRDSGQYENRGTLLGQFCMARRWDRGPYVVGNVEIQTVSENQATKTTRRWMRRLGPIRGESRLHGSDPDDLRDIKNIVY